MKHLLAIMILMIGLIACSGESPLTIEPPVEQQIFSCPGPVAYIENCMKCHGDD